MTAEKVQTAQKEAAKEQAETDLRWKGMGFTMKKGKKKKQSKFNHGENQANATKYSFDELLDPLVEKYGKEQVISKIAKGAKQGRAPVQRILGAMYDIGKVVEQNSREAVRWYRKSAKRGYANGQYALGDAYYSGRGIKQNKKKAIRWFKRAAKQGHTGAQCFLCRMHRAGDGVEASQLNAFRWYMPKRRKKLMHRLERKNAELAEKDALITRKDAEIAKLKAQLSKATGVK